MSKNNVYILGGGTSGKFTYKPVKVFEEMALKAAYNSLEIAGIYPDSIDNFTLASMAPGGFGVEGGEIAVRIARKLGLKKSAEVGTVKVTSSTGGAALSRGYKEVAYFPGIGTSLIIGCEYMGEDKETKKRILASAVGEKERNHSFGMVDEGDLMMGPLIDWFGLSEKDFRKQILSRIAVSKYERAKEWPDAQYVGTEIDFNDYEKSKKVTSRFNLHDIVAPSNGASAIILSKQKPSGIVVRIKGSGQGVTDPSVSDRKGPIDYSQGIRYSYAQVCEDAGVSLGYLRNTLVSDFAIIHDAFPSIEIAFLKELGFGKKEIVNLLISGKTNYCGGLKACGHAIGASGVLQAVQAWKRLLSGNDKRCFITSVGGPLTNVYTSILDVQDARGGFPKLSEGESYTGSDFDTYLEPNGEYQKIINHLSDNRGIVIANTVIKGKHVNLVQMGPEDHRELVSSKKRIDLGSYVKLKPSDEGTHATPLYRRIPMKLVKGTGRKITGIGERWGIKREAKTAFANRR